MYSVRMRPQADFPELPEALLAALGPALAASGSFGLKEAPVDPVLLCKVGETMCAAPRSLLNECPIKHILLHALCEVAS